MKILITGGCGFIGSALVRYLIDCTTAHIVNIDKLTYAGNPSNLKNYENSERYTFAQVDICDASALEVIFEQHEPDAVMHLAAESHVDRSIAGADAFVQTNIVGTYSLLEVSRGYWEGMYPDDKKRFRFLHVSTDEVYGDLPHPDNDDAALDKHFTEKTAYAPSSPYSATKASSDHLVRAWHRTYGLPVLITNCSNNYGPFQFPEKLIPNTIISAINNKPLPIYGNGTQIRDWLFVDDHVRALYEVLLKGSCGDTYNIGGHNELRNIEVVESICDLLDSYRPTAEPYRALISFVEDRPGHDCRYSIDASKMYDRLAWQPSESFDSGLRKTVEWYISHETWWKRILSGDYLLTRQGRTHFLQKDKMT